MYSIVLMAALTTAPTTQGWHRRCHGCQGSCVAACSCYTGCSCSYGCHGCSGYAYYGSGCYGCYGYQSYGVGNPGVLVCNGCYGCYGGWSCYGYQTHYGPVEAAPPSTGTPDRGPAPKPGKAEETPAPREKKGGEEQARARVIIDLPSDAKLFVDDQPMSIGTGRRLFQTPPLVRGQTYFYELRVEVTRDGRTQTATQRVILQPGQQAVASFADLGQAREATAQAGEQ